MSKKPFYIDWVAKDALDGMNQLAPMEELAYRRIIDMIYASDDQLLDDDESLKWSTKTGNKWKSIKARLIALGKIQLVSGRITNTICQEKLAEAHSRINAASVAGKASANKRKSLKSKKTDSTGVDEALGSTYQREHQRTSSERTNQLSTINTSEDKSSSVQQEHLSLGYYEGLFETFWKGWIPFEMSKGDKRAAEKSYHKARKDTEHDTLIQRRDQYLENCRNIRCKTKHVATWLNQRGWESDDATGPISNESAKRPTHGFGNSGPSALELALGDRTRR